MGTTGGVRLAEPVHDVSPVRRVAVVERGEQVDAGSRRVEIGDADHDVDDRLGGQAGDGGAADVVHTAGDPEGEGRGEEARLAFEVGWPGRVVRVEGYDLVIPSLAMLIVGHHHTLPHPDTAPARPYGAGVDG